MPERHLALEGCYNLRDLGGYPTADGRLTRWRTVLRSDSLHQLSPAAQQQLIAEGVRTIIDLRWAGEAQVEPSVFAEHPSVRYRLVPFYGAASPYELSHPRSLSALYQLDLERQQPEIRAILLSLLEPATTPAIIHCAIGKDRTGLISALLLGLAGVPDDVIIADYALSADYLGPYLDELRSQVSAEDLAEYGFSLLCEPHTMAATLAYLHQQYGGIRAYARHIDLTDVEIARLHRLLVT